MVEHLEGNLKSVLRAGYMCEEPIHSIQVLNCIININVHYLLYFQLLFQSLGHKKKERKKGDAELDVACECQLVSDVSSAVWIPGAMRTDPGRCGK